MKTLRNNWEIAVWSGCMLFGGLLLVSQLAVASRADRVEMILARQAVDAAQDEVVAPVMTEEAPAALAMARPAKAPKARPDRALTSDLLVEAIVQVESAGNPRQVGRQGERGLMQIKARTWAQVTRNLFGRKLPFDQAFNGEVNRQVGRAYLAELHDFLVKHRGQWKADERSLLLACYNAGPNRVKKAGFSLRNLPSSTQDYIERASALHDDFLFNAAKSVVAGELPVQASGQGT